MQMLGERVILMKIYSAARICGIYKLDHKLLDIRVPVWYNVRKGGFDYEMLRL